METDSSVSSTEEFACNGSLVDDEEMGQVIQLQGDQRTKIVEILVGEGIGAFSIGQRAVAVLFGHSADTTFVVRLADKDIIKLHGF